MNEENTFIKYFKDYVKAKDSLVIEAIRRGGEYIYINFFSDGTPLWTEFIFYEEDENDENLGKFSCFYCGQYKDKEEYKESHILSSHYDSVEIGNLCKDCQKKDWIDDEEIEGFDIRDLISLIKEFKQ